MNKFSIVAKEDNCSRNIAEQVRTRLLAENWQEDRKAPALVIFVGGDGTFLYAAHKYMALKDCLYVGIHTGTLGFFTDYTKDELELCLTQILAGHGIVKPLPLLKVDVVREAGVETLYAVNEMRIENVIRTLNLEVLIDHEFFESYRGTGMCISTQAGSTAYNRSLKGAVIDEGLNLLQVHEITGIHHSQYHSLGVPLILNANRVITLKSNNFKDSVLCYDHKHIEMDDVMEVRVTMSERAIHFVHYRENSYLKRLRNLY